MIIRIKFLGVIYQVKVVIFDECDELVYSGQTSQGYVDVLLCPGKVYKLMASMPCEMFTTYFYVSNRKMYCFMFPSLYMSDVLDDGNKVTLFLTDYFYPNLPIERGEITLWQR